MSQGPNRTGDPLLDAALDVLREVPLPPAERREAGHTAYMAQVRQARLQGPGQRIEVTGPPPRRRLAPGFAGMLLALVAALALLGGGLAVASDAASPGDTLYSVDRALEGVSLAVRGGTSEARLRLLLADERLAEAEDLLARGKQDQMRAALQDLDAAIAALEAAIPGAAPQAADELSVRLAGLLEARADLLARIRENMPGLLDDSTNQALPQDAGGAGPKDRSGEDSADDRSQLNSSASTPTPLATPTLGMINENTSTGAPGGNENTGGDDSPGSVGSANDNATDNTNDNANDDDSDDDGDDSSDNEDNSSGSGNGNDSDDDND
ncbi:MAG: hypothetical protein Kow00124_20260 [Anaerolineae bacterium]